MPQDFASAVMIALIHSAMARQEIMPTALAGPPRHALSNLADKRAVLGHIWLNHGPLAILKVGDAVADAPADPVLDALLMAQDCLDLIVRWCRLERFIHSRHRVRVTQTGIDNVTLEHISVAVGEPPHPAEDCLIVAVLTGLAQRIGVERLTVWLGPDVIFEEGGFIAPGPKGLDRSAQWRIAWKEGTRSAASSPTADNSPPALLSRVQELFTQDSARAWSANAVAQRLAISERSLQRRLAEHGTSVHGLLREAQLSRATQLLLETERPVQEIAFVCGFADQAHFTRAFKRRTNIAPARFRKEFQSI